MRARTAAALEICGGVLATVKFVCTVFEGLHHLAECAVEILARQRFEDGIAECEIHTEIDLAPAFASPEDQAVLDLACEQLDEYFAGERKQFDVSIALQGTVFQTKVWSMLEDRKAPEPRTARFCCTLCLAWPDGHDEVFDGKVEGRIVWPMRGELGFGFDPIFLPDGETETFGEMDQGKKHRMSHRADAFRKLIAGCFA